MTSRSSSTTARCSADDKDAIAAEVFQIAKEIEDIVDRHEVQRQRAVFGSAATFTFQVGANDGETIATDAPSTLAASVAGTAASPS